MTVLLVKPILAARKKTAIHLATVKFLSAKDLSDLHRITWETAGLFHIKEDLMMDIYDYLFRCCSPTGSITNGYWEVIRRLCKGPKIPTF